MEAILQSLVEKRKNVGAERAEAHEPYGCKKWYGKQPYNAEGEVVEMIVCLLATVVMHQKTKKILHVLNVDRMDISKLVVA